MDVDYGRRSVSGGCQWGTVVQLLVLIWAAARFDSVAVMLLAVGLLPFQERALRSHSYTL